MEGWTCSQGTDARNLTEVQRVQCWNEFVTNFNLKDVDNNPAAYNNKSIYFRPSCTPVEPTGTSGGVVTNVLAKYPKIVQ